MLFFFFQAQASAGKSRHWISVNSCRGQTLCREIRIATVWGQMDESSSHLVYGAGVRRMIKRGVGKRGQKSKREKRRAKHKLKKKM